MTLQRPRRLVLIGSVLVDVLMYVDQLPERGGDRVVERCIVTSGGGFNVLVGVARLGLPSAYAGRVGDGPFGQQVAKDLAAAGIGLLLPRVTGEDSGFDIGFVERDGERTFVTAPGCESRLQRADLLAVPLQPGDAVYVSGYDLCYPVSGAALGAWLPMLGEEHLVLVDPGPLVADIPAERLVAVLARTDILTLNARETRLLTGSDDTVAGAAALTERVAPHGWVVARAGAHGCWVASRTQAPVHVPPRPAEATDTTGAGDAHAAALLARISLGEDLVAAAWAANVAASIAVERRGPAAGPDAPELDALLMSTGRS